MPSDVNNNRRPFRLPRRSQIDCTARFDASTAPVQPGQAQQALDEPGRLAEGFSIKEVMTFVGHSSIQITMERYGHLFPSPDHQKAMAMVEAKLLG